MTAPLKPPVGGSPAASADEAARAAKMLEAYFLRRVLSEVRGSSEASLLGGGYTGQVFREMLDEALADQMAEAGGIGLASVIEKQLGADPAGRAAGPPASARAIRAAYGAMSGSASGWQPLGESIDAPPDGSRTWQMPVEATRLSSGFGKLRSDPESPSQTRRHRGLDLIAPIGTPVHAARAGQVLRAGSTAGGFGNLVVLDHGEGVHSYYGHLSRVDARVGDRVEAGTPIGAVGSTGRSSAPHLHFEVRRHGVSIDPTTDIEGLKIENRRTNR